MKTHDPIRDTLLLLCALFSLSTFASPLVRGPEAWLEFMGGNVAREGLRKDLEEIKRAGISGVQMFHISKGPAWPDCPEQIHCMSEKWEEVVSFLGDECRRLGLKLTVQNCPGWSQSGGPWIAVTNAMREAVCSQSHAGLPPIPAKYRDADSNWRDIAVLAFPTPLDDACTELKPTRVVTNGFDRTYFFDQPVTIRTAIWKDGVDNFNSNYPYHAPWMHVKLEAMDEDGTPHTAFNNDLPMSDWRDYVYTFSLACDEWTAREWRFTFTHQYPIRRYKEPVFTAAARQTDWEGKSSLVLRSRLFERSPRQNPRCWIKQDDILDITDRLRPDGTLDWKAPTGDWTILRVGHVNSKRVNAPAPKEATGWECDKLAPEGIEANFNGYVKRLMSGPLAGKLDGMIVDSWECFGQTWTPRMAQYFRVANGYDVRLHLPALFGWVIDSPDATERFLTDWRRTIGDLITKNYYGHMAKLAHAHGLTVAYETAFGDIIAGDLLEYWKYADEPMCEYWLPHTPKSKGFVGSRAYKPIRPCASAAHIYGKRRVTAEAFTGWGVTWNEDFRELRDVANRHFAWGVTHLAFQSYTHSPNPNALPPGACMGGWNGTPFTHLQTWWRHMPEFTGWLTRCEERLEEGLPANDVLWYLGDAVDHKPDEYFAFPEGFAADYLNHDVLTNRLAVKNGLLTVPEGTTWKILWVPEEHFMLPTTRRQLDALATAGAKIVYGGKKALAQALKSFTKDVTTSPALGDEPSEDFMWIHRRIGTTDRYFVAAGTNGYCGKVTFRAQGNATIYDPVSEENQAWQNGTELTLHPSQSLFIDFAPSTHSHAPLCDSAPPREINPLPISAPFTLSFAPGWGAPTTTTLTKLVPWCEIPGFTDEAKSYSGTVTYDTTFNLNFQPQPLSSLILDLGRVETIAKVFVNGKVARTLWCKPYRCDITHLVQPGTNALHIEVTSTWHNRVVYDFNQPAAQRKTWTIYNPGFGPAPTSPRLPSGLLGPVTLKTSQTSQPPLMIQGLTNAVLRGAGTPLIFHGKGPRLVITNCCNVTMRGWHFIDDTREPTPAVDLHGENITLEECTFDRVPGPAIHVCMGSRKVTVRNNRFLDCQGYGGDAIISLAANTHDTTIVGNHFEQFKTTLLAATGSHDIDWHDNEVKWNGHRLALWGHLFAIASCSGVNIRYDGQRIQEDWPPFGRLNPSATPTTREYIWPEGQMPDVQPNQVAAKYHETLQKDFNPAANRRPYVDWYLPSTHSRAGFCLVTVSGGGFACCCDGERLAPAIDRLVRAGVVVADLTYRTPRPQGKAVHASAMQDLTQALDVVRSHAAEYGFDPRKVGALGNSAGAKAVAIATTNPANDLRFAILLAPAFVLSDGACGENKFGGDGPGVTMVPELTYGPKTCPMCLFQGGDDAYSPFSSIALFEALTRWNIATDLHLYGLRWHGFQGNLNRAKAPTGWDRWFDRVEEFLVREGLFPAPAATFISSAYGRQAGKTIPLDLWKTDDHRLTLRLPTDRTTDDVMIVLTDARTREMADALYAEGHAVVTLDAAPTTPQDIRRAVRKIHERVRHYDITSNRIGLIGAGKAADAALLAATTTKRRIYNPVDEIDTYPARLDWAVILDPTQDPTDVYDINTCPILFIEKEAKTSVSLEAWKKLHRMGIACDLHITPATASTPALVAHIEQFLNDRWQNRAE